MTYDAAIVGAGFSGTMVAFHLARGAPELSVVGFESGKVGRGAAYGTRYREHLLNTRAGAMSALPDDAGHFVRWLNDRGTANDFVPRALYGDYLAQFASEAFERDNARIVRDRIVDVRRDGDAFELRTAGGASWRARSVVLATGNAAPDEDVLPESVVAHRGYIADPWRCDYAAMQGPVLLIGSGLTALDVLVALEAEGHRGDVDVVSRGGRFPETHLESLSPLVSAPVLGTSNALTLLRTFRRRVREAAESGFDWRAVVDALRPECEALWRRLPAAERRRFDRRLRSRWERHRHRAPQGADAARARYAAAGRLRVYAGRLDPASGESIVVRTRDGHTRRLRPDWIVNCTGPARGRRLFADPLLRALAQRGSIVPEPLGLGVCVDDDLRVLAADGTVVPGLFVVGPLARGTRFEATAVPELRSMAQAVASAIVGSAKKAAPSGRRFLDAKSILVDMGG